MNAEWIIAVFVVIDTLMERLGHQSDKRADVPDSEVVLIAVVAAQYFHNHHERAVCLLQQTGYLSGRLSVSRFNRRMHALADWLGLIVETLGALALDSELFIIDSMPVPVCRRVRARRCRKVRGREFCGYCAAKKETFFGWRLHIVCSTAGVPVSYDLRPAALHDITPVHELLVVLPPGARVLGDKGYVSKVDAASILAETGVSLIAARRVNMEPNTWLEREELRQHRHAVETLNSQLERMAVEHLYARTNAGLDIKVHASMIALAWTNLN